MAVLVGVGCCHEMRILQGFVQDAKFEARLGAFVLFSLLFLKFFHGLLESALATFEEGLVAFNAEESVSGLAVKFLGSPGKQGG
jgi:hypothetical protein